MSDEIQAAEGSSRDNEIEEADAADLQVNEDGSITVAESGVTSVKVDRWLAQVSKQTHATTASLLVSSST